MLIAAMLLTLLTTVGAVVAQPAHQNYPNKPIRFISPNAPGGSTSALARLIGHRLTENWGQQVIVDNRPGGNGYIGGDRLHAIAVSGETRLVALPQTPTFTEAGLPGFRITSWYGILTTAGTPKPIVDKLSAEVARYLASPDLKEKLLAQGMNALVASPEQFASLMKADTAKYAKVIKTANIKAD
jgi:tripartite-type tricarboxylate transporter receptor subunit TctC